jgi:hypothetical protein
VGKPDLGCKKDEWVDDAVKDRKGEYLEASVNFVAVRILNLNTGDPALLLGPPKLDMACNKKAGSYLFRPALFQQKREGL